MVFMGVSLSQSIEREQALLEHDLITKAWLISDDVDEELRAQFDFVRAFADLPALDPPADVDQLTKWMSRAITHEPFWRSANVFDADEKLIFKLGGWGGKQITAVEPERCYGAGGEDGNFVALHQSMECRDAPAERFEQVPRRPGPK